MAAYSFKYHLVGGYKGISRAASFSGARNPAPRQSRLSFIAGKLVPFSAHQIRWYIEGQRFAFSTENLLHSSKCKIVLPPARPLALQSYQIRCTALSPRHQSTAAPAHGSSLPPYQPPTNGLLSVLPPSLIPYAELIRLDKPTGTYYLFFPCLFSTLLAAPLATPITPPSTVLATTALFATGALIMRGAGCTINDLWDRNLDPHVARTRLRPIARRAITPFQGVAFFGAQCLAGLGVLVQFPTECLWYGIPSLLLVGTYPLAKRITHYPQVVLGLAFSWGGIMGFPALGVDLLSNPSALHAAAALYASCVAWTVGYDMIYAHMDIKDDKKAGIKSIALRHEKETKGVLTGLAAVQVGLLGAAGWAVGAGPIYYLGTCGGAAATMGIQIIKVKLDSVADCWWWFKWGCWFTGGAVTTGLLGEYLVRFNAEAHENQKRETSF
ncbi:4-hydroxybenzoate polyprenyl transferase [Eremomyces bilateralis CBS 781.70]|uniref:4-hydroxybenzoate polyprenyltransferase, mitochondrial n=1 Tax=Eremomyces bilateralis CBS 781.70 TaxID=1392243 RepID=A0A6G1G9D6_9PEZI|nr:4-hydroxybenzoate polyprenyl transferase [Eremomyces bilateralis CBS 781.70]KAF1814520.1 4-hydroxybenzoate polyprenyl transferase [Eremomyces bilateralis CBS 781.70]